MTNISNKKYLALGLVVIGLVFAAVGIVFGLITHRLADPASAPLPDKVTSLSLTSKSSGLVAVAEVAHLHNQTFWLTSASVGRYGDNQSVTVWTTGAPFQFLAKQMLVDMRDKIDAVETLFTPTSERVDGNRIVYELQGLGQIHFYFQSGNLIVWMAADQQLAEPAINELLEFYP